MTAAHEAGEITEAEMHRQLASLPERFLPPWLSDFAIAEVLGIPVPEVRQQSARMLYRAGVVLGARQEAQAMRRANGP